MLNEQVIKELLLKTAARNTDAFSRLYEVCAPILLGVALRIVGRKEVAEEVIQDVFIKIWNNANRFDPLSNQPIGWMVTMTRNRALDIIGSADVARISYLDANQAEASSAILDELLGTNDTDPSKQEENRRASSLLRRCIEGLQPNERQSITLAYYHGLSHHELASHLTKPLGSIKTWIRRGMANLKNCVEECAGALR